MEQENLTGYQENDITPPDDHAINLLRERTFNDELRRLVETVTGRESVVASSHEEADDSQAISPGELLVKFHRLFYRARNISSLEGANISFNPFSDKELYTRLHEAVREQIISALQEIAPGGGVLFSYDFKQKGYTTYCASMPGLSPAAVVIGLHDALLRKIADQPRGGLFDVDDIGEESFLGSMLAGMGDRIAGSRLYLLNLQFITGGIDNDFDEAVPGSLSSYLPSPILMLICGRDDPPDASRWYTLVVEKLAFLLSFLEENELSDFSLKTSDTMAMLFSKMEYFCQRSLNSGFNGICVFRSGNADPGSLFIMKYIFSVLKHRFSDDIIPVRLNPGVFAFFYRKNLENQLVQAFSEYLMVMKNGISLELLDNSDMGSFSKVLFSLFS